MNRKEIEQYFINKYNGDTFFIDALKSKNDSELKKVYDRSITRDNKENEILDNGTKTFTIDFDEKLNKEVEKYMWEHNLFTMFDGKIQYRCSNDGRLLGVPIQFIEDLQKEFDIKMSREMYILGRKDIQGLEVGDKVSVLTSGIFGNSLQQGTVYLIKDDEVVIRKYRSKTKGWTLNVGDECMIEKITKFQKAS